MNTFNTFTMADAERVLKAFNGGLVTEPDAGNPRGFTVRYKPQAAMLRALEALFPDYPAAVAAASKRKAA